MEEPFNCQVILQRFENGLVGLGGNEFVHVLVERVPFSNYVDEAWIFDLLEEVEGIACEVLHYGFGVGEFWEEGRG